ncbi:MAG: hypothetical protein ACOY3L_09760 [Pseudomonadota bacterium]
MKKALYATAGSALALVLLAAAVPASADVNVTATITKNKDITITERITINKTIGIIVASRFTEIVSAAEAQAVMNVDNFGNRVDGAGDPEHPDQPGGEPGVADYNLHLSAVIGGADAAGSINGNTGVFGVNQDVGNMTNQGNVVSVAGIANLPAFANAQAEADQSNTNNSVRELELLKHPDGEHFAFDELFDDVTPSSFLVNKEAKIVGSINNNTGVINVNQNAGNMNNQTNGVAAAVGEGALVALSEAALGQVNAHNKVVEAETVKHGLIDGSVNNNTGIVNVNQSTGNMNNQGNVVSLAAITSGAILDQ